MLQPFGERIWIADGPIATVAGFRYPTRMAVIALASGKLFVWSPVALSPELRRATDALGEVAHLVAPNSLHHLFLAEWAAAYPEARVHAAPGLAARRQDLALDAELGADPDPAWAEDLDQTLVSGNAITTEAVFFHRPSRTAIFTDLLQQFPPGWFGGWRAGIARLDRMTGAQPQVPQKFRLAFTDRAAARKALAHILAWPTEQVLMAHGEPVRSEGRAFLARAFAWLKP